MIRKMADMDTEVRENMRGGAGSVTFRHMFKKEEFTAPVRLCSVLTIPPGSGIGSHEHLTEDEIYIVTQGAGMLDDGKTKTRVAKGDTILTGNGASHAIHNDGQEALELMAIIICYPE